MKTIETKYHGATNTKPSRVSATTQENPRIYLSYDHELDITDMHAKAARTLRDKMEWTGAMVGGGTKAGMVWVFEQHSPRIEWEA